MNKKTILIIIGAVILGGLIVILNLVSQDQGTKVEVKTVSLGSIEYKVSGSGELRAQNQVSIQAQTMGVVEKLYVKEGMLVRQGDLICVLEQKTARANLEIAKAQYEQAELSFRRAESLYKANLISTQEYENTRINYRIARARLEQAEDSYQKTMITAPISGIVTQLNIKEGETAILGTFNNPGTILMVIADLSKMIAVVNVDETKVVFLKPGLKANIQIDAFPDSIFSGTVSKIGFMPRQNLLIQTTSTKEFEVEIILDRSSEILRPGMSLNAEIVAIKKDSIITIPIQATGRRKIKGVETQSVFIVDKNIARLRAITTGISGETEIEIIDGLKINELVITGPYKTLMRLKDGERVTY
jgi:HlyD family secretion protein